MGRISLDIVLEELSLHECNQFWDTEQNQVSPFDKFSKKFYPIKALKQIFKSYVFKKKDCYLTNSNAFSLTYFLDEALPTK